MGMLQRRLAFASDLSTANQSHTAWSSDKLRVTSHTRFAAKMLPSCQIVMVKVAGNKLAALPREL